MPGALVWFCVSFPGAILMIIVSMKCCSAPRGPAGSWSSYFTKIKLPSASHYTVTGKGRKTLRANRSNVGWITLCRYRQAILLNKELHQPLRLTNPSCSTGGPNLKSSFMTWSSHNVLPHYTVTTIHVQIWAWVSDLIPVAFNSWSIPNTAWEKTGFRSHRSTSVIEIVSTYSYIKCIYGWKTC